MYHNFKKTYVNIDKIFALKIKNCCKWFIIKTFKNKFTLTLITLLQKKSNIFIRVQYCLTKFLANKDINIVNQIKQI